MQVSPWPERDGELGALWAEGHSTLEIGRRMNITKNSVVGRAHRLGLTARPSPIMRGDPLTPPRPPKPRRAKGATLPALASVSPAHVTGVAVSEAPMPAPRRTAEPPPPRRIPARARGTGGAKLCCWPLGDPKDREHFRFCNADADDGMPYCPGHRAIAYLRVRDTSEDAPAGWVPGVPR